MNRKGVSQPCEGGLFGLLFGHKFIKGWIEQHYYTPMRCFRCGYSPSDEE